MFSNIITDLTAIVGSTIVHVRWLYSLGIHTGAKQDVVVFIP